MQNRIFDTVTHDIARILHAVDEIALQAETLATREALAASGLQSDAEARLTLETIAATLDRIVSKARRVETLVSSMPDPALARDLHDPSVQLRDAITSLVVSAYGAAGAVAGYATPPPRFHAA